ncbi:DUF4167 domain-containing protein [Pelagibacteraceae bacterium]|nr:DUF4167 domain-containing protein [Pelagibacteraceae bacterium]
MMYKKTNGRTTYKTSRRPTYKKTGGYQNYKGRNKGNVSQQYNKYLKLAKEAFRSGDRIQSEYYYQYMDHYYRLMVELGISVEENNQNNEVNQSSTIDSPSEDISTDDNLASKTEDQSIESIPFIAEDSKIKKSKISE